MRDRPLNTIIKEQPSKYMPGKYEKPYVEGVLLMYT
jgi:hypothetical protein